MGTMTEVRIPAAEFALQQTLSDVPSATVTVHRVETDAPDGLVPFCWVTADDLDTLHGSFEADGSVGGLRQLSEVDEERLYRMSWVGGVDLVGRVLREEDGTVLSATGTGDGWRLRLLFPDETALRRTQVFADHEGWTMEVEAVYELAETPRERYGLTKPQHDTLVSAYEHGYYDFPHGVTTAELGAEFDVTAQAAADRLRRGHGNLVEEALLTTHLADADR
ncbi:bacterio-opsin activator domain-containing protein [Halomarina rubra]|uniref:Bacterio-opsin activator domain-containing protein n=1 Tax=Halomarina rubra TaxID=2071873 RepID=A0ABD6AS14_9EURY|nr:helix-turn-helix domain-containing protein [Halomarina rubra]